MRPYFPLSFAVVAAFAIACGGDTLRPLPSLPDAGAIDAAPTARVRFATFNVHRFFDTVCDSGDCNGAGSYEDVATKAQFDSTAARLGTGIRGLAVDVVMLEEIETQPCLDALMAHLTDVLPYGELGETGAPASVDVAILSAAPIESVVRHRDQLIQRPDGSTTTFSRELLEVHLTLHGRHVIAFAAHFRSKVNDDPGRRLAEARATHDIVNAAAVAAPDALVILGGDLNDVPGSPPIDALEGDGLLHRVARDRALPDQGTYRFGTEWQAIDHLFQAGTAGGTYVKGSATSVRGNPGYAGSDHAALRADFDLR
ncbi:hypothetical protein BH09MYX1_BH09MYX1_44810 [soil metagenome]